MPPEQDEKTESATPKRREESREKGQVAKSREVTSVAVLLAGILYFQFFADDMGRTIGNIARHFFRAASIREIKNEGLHSIMMEAAQGIGEAIFPLLAFVALFSVAAHVIQFGFLFAPPALVPKLGRLNPLEGAKRLFGKQGWMDLFKSLAKVIMVGYVAFVTLNEAWVFLPQLTQMSPTAILAQFFGFAMKILVRCAVVLVFIAAIDYAFQRYSFEKSIRMTKDEVKQEYKQREGDPLVKSRVRQVQREMTRKRMMANLPKADVVITNPTHYAIAIRYEREEMDAPVILAKGKGFIALKIKEKAKELNIPLVENKPLAQGLYQAVGIGETVPSEFYKAVAEVLAYVFTLKNKAA